MRFGAAYLLSHGGVKIVRPAAEQTLHVHQMTFAPTIRLAALTAFEAVVTWLT